MKIFFSILAVLFLIGIIGGNPTSSRYCLIAFIATLLGIVGLYLVN